MQYTRRSLPRGRLAQLVRARASHARGHRFESYSAHYPQPMHLSLELIPERLAIGRLERDSAIPAWAVRGAFFSVTKTPTELSVVCESAAIPSSVRAERGWRALRVKGPLDFELTGILAGLAVPLANAGSSIFAISTFDTDYILVRERDVPTAVAELRSAGHSVESQEHPNER